jgi:hypothetical protein
VEVGNESRSLTSGPSCTKVAQVSKLVTIKTRVTQTEAEQLSERARSEDRSLASLLRNIIRETLSNKEAA